MFHQQEQHKSCIVGNANLLSCGFLKLITPIENIKTTSMEDVSTRVLEKLKNI